MNLRRHGMTHASFKYVSFDVLSTSSYSISPPSRQLLLSRLRLSPARALAMSFAWRLSPWPSPSRLSAPLSCSPVHCPLSVLIPTHSSSLKHALHLLLEASLGTPRRASPFTPPVPFTLHSSLVTPAVDSWLSSHVSRTSRSTRSAPLSHPVAPRAIIASTQTAT